MGFFKKAMTYTLNEEGIKYLNKQVKVMRNGWYYYLPLALFLYTTAIIDRWDGNFVKHIIIGSLTMGLTLVYLFIILPIKRVKVMNNIVENLTINEDYISLQTFGIFWKKPQVIQIALKDFHIFEHATEKGRNLFELSSTYRIHDIPTAEQYYLAPQYIASWDDLYEKLTELKYQ
ncbi:hypothetical protein [Olivibacter domesticus]|nr:hypothetical protein [Olivibacter domesticus]